MVSLCNLRIDADHLMPVVRREPGPGDSETPPNAGVLLVMPTYFRVVGQDMQWLIFHP